MKFNSIIVALLLLVFSNQLLFSQETNQACSCELLKETEDNDARVIALAQYIEDSFLEVKSDGFIEKFDLASFKKLVLDNQEVDPKDEFTIGYINGIENIDSNLSKKITEAIEAGSYYNLVNYRYIIEDNAYYFTFRLYSEETGINYHDYKVCFDGKNIKFNDLYIYLTGEKLTKTFQRILIMSKPSDKRLQNLFGVNSSKEILKVVEAKKFAEKKNFKKAYTIISSIKGEMAKEKFILMIKSIYASAFDDTVYEKVLEEFAALHPDDPTLYLKQIDYNILKENYTEALKNVEKLQYETDDDFLNLIKANIYMLNESFSEAEAKYKYMTINYPDLLEGYVGYMVSLNFQNRFEAIINIIEDLISQDYDQETLIEFIEEKEPDGSNALAAFVKSKVYKNWKRKL